jgi:hypothetical protein
MLLLPISPDLEMDQQATGPLVIAGFNPVAMLQIFLGTERGAVSDEGLELEESVAPRVDEAGAASSPLAFSEQLLVGTFVVVVGYWYLHARDDISFSVCLAPTIRDRRPRRRKPLRKYFGLG